MPIVLLFASALAGCGSQARDVDRLDGQLLNAATARGVATSTARAPAHVAAEAAEPQGEDIGACYAALRDAPGWTRRLPEALALPADAIVREAAGTDRPGCATRVVSFATALPPARLAEAYRAQTDRAGYAAGIERRGTALIVAGEHAGDARAFVVTLAPRAGGGADVDLVSSGVPAAR